MSLVEEAIREAIEEHFPTRKEEFEHLPLEELLLFLKISVTLESMMLEDIERIQGRFMDLLDIKYAEEDRVIETGESDPSVPLPKIDDLEGPDTKPVCMGKDIKLDIVNMMKHPTMGFCFVITDDDQQFNVGHVGMGAYSAVLSQSEFVDATKELIQEGVLIISDKRLTIPREFRADEIAEPQYISGRKIIFYEDNS